MPLSLEHPLAAQPMMDAPDERHAETPALRRRHWEMLCVSLLVVLMAPILHIRPDQRLTLPGLSSLPLPAMCLSREWFHVDCPGCGLTRSIILLAHGHVLESFRMHRIGWLMALAILLQFPYRIACLRARRMILGRRVPEWFGSVLIVALIGNWLFNVFWRHL